MSLANLNCTYYFLLLWFLSGTASPLYLSSDVINNFYLVVKVQPCQWVNKKHSKHFYSFTNLGFSSWCTIKQNCCYKPKQRNHASQSQFAQNVKRTSHNSKQMRTTSTERLPNGEKYAQKGTTYLDSTPGARFFNQW